MSVSRETDTKLQSYQILLEKWSRRINLVSRSTISALRKRHIEDSVQLAAFGGDGVSWCDLGSGAGLPGMVVAICRPDISVQMIESDKRKVVFLQHVIDELNISARVSAGRIETESPARADVVSARALAPLDKLLPLAQRHGVSDTMYVFPKGRNYAAEIAAARKSWSFDVDVRPSSVEKDGVILIVENIARV